MLGSLRMCVQHTVTSKSERDTDDTVLLLRSVVGSLAKIVTDPKHGKAALLIPEMPQRAGLYVG